MTDGPNAPEEHRDHEDVARDTAAEASSEASSEAPTETGGTGGSGGVVLGKQPRDAAATPLSPEHDATTQLPSYGTPPPPAAPWGAAPPMGAAGSYGPPPTAQFPAQPGPAGPQFPPPGPPAGPGPYGPGGPSGPFGPPPDQPGAFGPAPSGDGGSGKRRNRLLVGGLVAAAVIVGAGVGVAVAVGTDDSGSSGTPLGAPSSTTPGSPVSGDEASGNAGQHNDQGKQKKQRKQKNKQQRAMRGTITAEDGSTWTVKNQQGQSVKVTITGDTQFGNKKAPAKASDFAVGSKVAVIGKAANGAISAVRVRSPQQAAGQHPGKSTAPGTSSPSTPAPSSSPS